MEQLETFENQELALDIRNKINENFLKIKGFGDAIDGTISIIDIYSNSIKRITEIFINTDNTTTLNIDDYEIFFISIQTSGLLANPKTILLNSSSTNSYIKNEIVFQNTGLVDANITFEASWEFAFDNQLLTLGNTFILPARSFIRCSVIKSYIPIIEVGNVLTIL